MQTAKVLHGNAPLSVVGFGSPFRQTTCVSHHNVIGAEWKCPQIRRPGHASHRVS